MTPPLPESLSYMEPFFGFLESLPRDAVNEDVDSRLLDDALRMRLATGDPHEILEADTEALENWLASFDSSAHPAHWIVGYLSYVLPEDIDPSIAPAPVEPLDPEVERSRFQTLMARCEFTGSAPEMTMLCLSGRHRSIASIKALSYC